MTRRTALVTGAAGELGHALIPALRARGYAIVALDLASLPEESARHCVEALQGSVVETESVRVVFERHRPEVVFHLAAVLSSKAEANPDLAHRVNVDATVGLLGLCRETATHRGAPVRFLFPSSIAVYGLPDAERKRGAGAVAETDWVAPAGAYGCHKVYGEMLGAYWTRRAAREGVPGVDFRAIRFPGLISADTMPSGGTSDFAPEMIHAAAQGKPYSCFVSEESRIPFMTMPDAVEAFVRLAEADASRLTTRVYNIAAFAPSAGEFRSEVLRHFPDASIAFEPVASRQAIVDTWPADVDDRLARRDWGHDPSHGLEEAVATYLVPALLRRYGARAAR
jgi:nucleoside-diphosphate-sugar epimerase